MTAFHRQLKTFFVRALQQVSPWLAANLLTLNSSKTYFFLIWLAQQLTKINSCSVAILVFISDEHFSLTRYLLYPKLATLIFVNLAVCVFTATLQPPLPLKLVVHSKLDYCNSRYSSAVTSR